MDPHIPRVAANRRAAQGQPDDSDVDNRPGSGHVDRLRRPHHRHRFPRLLRRLHGKRLLSRLCKRISVGLVV